MKKQNNEEMIDFLGYELPSYPASESAHSKIKNDISKDKGSNDKKSDNHNKGNGGSKTWK